ncbi:LacI family DNA-binding transcriptional regulator [Paenibacillus solisilvae]|uniref:LacI family DNA-binding transcriptional regulator n=1 Tax=Paenibacillus solisilvae TaxID=2486751 RepID=A0ABW0W6K4_9BACL
MKATIYDVAREAGVSIATVSKVINGKGKISEETRGTVLEIMARMNYQPSVIASALTGKKTYTLGLLVPDISNPFFAEIARAIEDQSQHYGYSVVMCSTDNKDKKVEKYIALLLQKSVDGIIIATGIDETVIMEQLLSKSLPVVLLAREMPHAAVNTVVVDDYVGGSLAADHLLGLGHKHIAVLGENIKVISSRERIRGFRAKLADVQIPMREDWLKYCDYRIEDGKQKALQLLQTEDRPTAIFACNDMLAVGALQAAKESGVKVPDDLSIVSFDNTILAMVTDPQLTTIAQPMNEMGKLAVDLIVDELKGRKNVKQRTVLRPELLIRQSTASRPGRRLPKEKK